MFPFSFIWQPRPDEDFETKREPGEVKLDTSRWQGDHSGWDPLWPEEIQPVSASPMLAQMVCGDVGCGLLQGLCPRSMAHKSRDVKLLKRGQGQSSQKGIGRPPWMTLQLDEVRYAHRQKTPNRALWWWNTLFFFFFFHRLEDVAAS